MKHLGVTATALVALAGAAQAGGLDRSGQPVSALFESGNYAELSFGSVAPTVGGVFNHPLAGALESGDVAPSYTQFGLALKMDVNDRLSFALIIDQPFGADVDYATAGYPLSGTTAEFNSRGITALARYRLNDTFSFHGGLRSVTIDADVNVVTGAGVYNASYEADSALGYVIGAAYERPDIAMRIALTYSSATEFSNVTTLTGLGQIANTEYTMPQSVNLDFQTGIAANTLLFGGIRWVDWTETVINSQFYPGNPLVDYPNDRITYTVGIGRKFSDSFSGAISVGYEQDMDESSSNLSPTDGYLSLQVGGSYTIGDIEINGGVRLIQIGDTTTEVLGADFADNTAVAYGLSVGYHF